MDYFAQQAERRSKLYPTEEAALAYLQDAYARLVEVGWRPGPAKGGDNLAMIFEGAATQVHYRDYSRCPNEMVIPCFMWRKAEPTSLPEHRMIAGIDPEVAARYLQRAS